MREKLIGLAILAMSCGGGLPPIPIPTVPPGGPSLCATGQIWVNQMGCICKPGHVPDEDGKGCHEFAPVTTTTTTTSTTSTTSTTVTTSTTTTTTLAVSACQLPPMPRDCGEDPPRGPKQWGCCSENEHTQKFQAQVRAAQERVAVLRPDLFTSPGHVSEANNKPYAEAVAKILREEFGLCATQGHPAEEVGVKDSNSFSEQYDLISGAGIVHLFQAVTCRPARF